MNNLTIESDKDDLKLLAKKVKKFDKNLDFNLENNKIIIKFADKNQEENLRKIDAFLNYLESKNKVEKTNSLDYQIILF